MPTPVPVRPGKAPPSNEVKWVTTLASEASTAPSVAGCSHRPARSETQSQMDKASTSPSVAGCSNRAARSETQSQMDKVVAEAKELRRPRRTHVLLDWRLWVTLLLTATVVGMGCWTFIEQEQGRRAASRHAAHATAAVYTKDLERQIRTSISSCHALSAMMKVDTANITNDNFPKLAEMLIETYGGITNMQLAPGGTVSQIYPLKDEKMDNTKALGHALLVDPKRRRGAVKAILQRRPNVIGPLRLRQGGVAVLARNPIFTRFAPEFLPTESWTSGGVTYVMDCSTERARLENCYFPGPIEDGYQTYFFGFATMLTLVSDLFGPLQLDLMESTSGLSFQLAAAVPHPSLSDVRGIVAHSSCSPPTVHLQDPVCENVRVEELDVHLILCVMPKGGWPPISDEFWVQFGLLLTLTVGTGAGLGFLLLTNVFAKHREAVRLAQAAVEARFQRVQRACAQVRRLIYPMHMVKLSDLETLGRLIPHESAMRKRLLFSVHRCDEAEPFFAEGYRAVFVSHQWLSFDLPDPDREHYNTCVAALQKIARDEQLGSDRLLMWMDYISIPQVNPYMQASAISSLTVYTTLCHHFLLVAPPTTHKDSGALCNLRTHSERGWCRLEQFARLTTSSEPHIYIATGTRDVEKVLVDDQLLESGLCVQEGAFTCCQRGHLFGEFCCDKWKCVDTQIGLYNYLMTRKDEQQGMSGELRLKMMKYIAEHKERIFPPALFSDLMEVLKEMPAGLCRALEKEESLRGLPPDQRLPPSIHVPSSSTIESQRSN